MSKHAQADRLLAYIRANGSVSRIEAIYKLGIIELHRCFAALELRGFRFSRTPETFTNQYGEKGRCKRYAIAVDPDAVTAS